MKCCDTFSQSSLLGADVARAKSEIKALVRAASDGSLTRDGYVAVRERVAANSRSWKWIVISIASVAFYSTISLYLMIVTSQRGGRTGATMRDVHYAVFMGKTPCVLFMVSSGENV